MTKQKYQENFCEQVKPVKDSVQLVMWIKLLFLIDYFCLIPL